MKTTLFVLQLKHQTKRWSGKVCVISWVVDRKVERIRAQLIKYPTIASSLKPSSKRDPHQICKPINAQSHHCQWWLSKATSKEKSCPLWCRVCSKTQTSKIALYFYKHSRRFRVYDLRWKCRVQRINVSWLAEGMARVKCWCFGANKL